MLNCNKTEPALGFAIIFFVCLNVWARPMDVPRVCSQIPSRLSEFIACGLNSKHEYLEARQEFENSTLQVAAFDSFYVPRLFVKAGYDDLRYSTVEQFLNDGYSNNKSTNVGLGLKGQWPTLGLEYATSIQQLNFNNYSDPGNANSMTTSSDLSITARLLKGNSEQGNLELENRRIEVRRNAQRIKMAQLQIVTQAFELFATCASLQERLDILTDAEKSAQELVQKTRDLLRVGKISGLDALGADAQLRKIQLNLASTRVQFVQAVRDLMAQTNIPSHLKVNPQYRLKYFSLDSVPVAENRNGESGNIEMHPVVQELKEQVKQSESDVSLQKNNLLPEVNVNLHSTSHTNPDTKYEPPFRRDYGGWGVGVELVFPLDRSQEKANLAAAQAKKIQVQQRQEEASRRYLRTLESSQELEKSAEQEVQMAKVSVEIETQRYDKAKAAFTLGHIAKSDVYIYQQELVNAKLVMINAKSNLLKSRAQIYLARANTDVFLKE